LQSLREILEPCSFEARIAEKIQGFLGRKWLFEETRRWLEESTSRMLWLKAGPGIGNGINPARPVVVRSVDVALNLIKTFHFDAEESQALTPDADGVLALRGVHFVSEEPITLYFKITD
jgi:hypothetical protein